MCREHHPAAGRQYLAGSCRPMTKVTPGFQKPAISRWNRCGSTPPPYRRHLQDRRLLGGLIGGRRFPAWAGVAAAGSEQRREHLHPFHHDGVLQGLLQEQRMFGQPRPVDKLALRDHRLDLFRCCGYRPAGRPSSRTRSAILPVSIVPRLSPPCARRRRRLAIAGDDRLHRRHAEFDETLDRADRADPRLGLVALEHAAELGSVAVEAVGCGGHAAARLDQPFGVATLHVLRLSSIASSLRQRSALVVAGGIFAIWLPARRAWRDVSCDNRR